jgi:fluoroacetyl-CoA thioesterase
MASERLTPGLTAEIETVVDENLVVKHMGGEGVLSTPSMIGLMECAGIQAVQAYLPEGHTTVGFEVNVKHFGATPKGQKVTVKAELLEVDRPQASLQGRGARRGQEGRRGFTSQSDYSGAEEE